MHLKRLYIKGYKSIKELDLQFEKGKNVLVGRNNAGKSNIVKALDLILGEANPTFTKSDNVSDDDFYSWKEMINGEAHVRAANEIFVWCELRREPGEALNYDEIYKCYGYYVLSEIERWENRKPVKQPRRVSKNELPKGYDPLFEMNEDDSEKEYVNPKLRNQHTFETQFENKNHFVFAFRAQRDSYGQIAKDIRFLYREDESVDWVLGFKAPVRNEFLQSAIIPSFRDPQSQLRLAHWTWYGKLMQQLTESHANSADLKGAIAGTKVVADRIFDSVRAKVKQSSLEVAFPGTELHFQFNTDSKTDLYKSCVIYVDDGFKSQLTEKGSGVQSATIIGLFTYYTQNVNTVTSALLCVEEPELYLHPHARRVISDRLDDFLGLNKNQVVLTTHSVEFIRTTSEDLNVILVRKGADGTSAIPVNIREFKSLLIDNNQNELFFADKVIVCEGHDDKIVRFIAKELFPKKLDEQNISIVSVGSKDNISRLIKLVLTLGIKCFLLADFDYLLRDKSEAARKYGKEPHEYILNVGDPFFSQPCTLGVGGAEVVARIKKCREEIKAKDEKLFYTAKSASEVEHKDLADLLARLRTNGICVLSGEIEHFSKDPTLLSPGRKMNLDKVFELNRRLDAGVKIVELFDTAEIAGFLNVAFER